MDRRTSLRQWVALGGIAWAMAAGPLITSRADEPGAAQEPVPAVESSAYYEYDELNRGLPPLDDPPDLETPRASLENFVFSGRQGDYRRAAYSLNLNALEPEQQAKLGPEYARRLHYMLERHIIIHWDQIPDLPDGVAEDFDPAEMKVQELPQRSVKLGNISLDERVVTIRLIRIKTPEEPPVWVFARQTVANVPALYEARGPALFLDRLPPFLSDHSVGRASLGQWIALILVLGLGVLLGWAVQEGLWAVARRSGPEWARHIVGVLRGPMAVTIALLVFQWVAFDFLRLASPLLAALDPMVTVLIIASLTWFTLRVSHLGLDLLQRRHMKRYEGQPLGAYVTRSSVARHFLAFLIVVVGMGIALSQFEVFRTLGLALLASAGAASLILGLAAQRTLSNIVAGLQLALSQPVAVGDPVIFNDEFGWVEEIAFTYIVIRTWDHRRIIVPIEHLLDNPLENWSRRVTSLIKPIYLYVDYRTEVEAIRRELETILEESEDWDHQTPPILHVTGCRPDALELRALCSASNPTRVWDLHCHVRERLVAFLQTLEHGRYLPRTRIWLDPEAGPRPVADSRPDAVPDRTPQGADTTPDGGAPDRPDEGDGRSDPAPHRSDEAPQPQTQGTTDHETNSAQDP